MGRYHANRSRRERKRKQKRAESWRRTERNLARRDKEEGSRPETTPIPETIPQEGRT
jgi:hypothetical protein